jgi:type VI secretion system secreted protein Hcp
MAFDSFLKIDGIDGESTDDKHKGWIEISSFSWGLAAVESQTGAGGGAGRAKFSELVISKKSDKATPALFLSCAKGKHIPQVTIAVRSASNEKREDYLQYKFSDVLISSYQTGGNTQGESRPLEEVSFKFSAADLLLDL